ncbi:MAG TPA: hypothetical protein VIF35_11005 [Streptosporangiaceae bacterium]
MPIDVTSIGFSGLVAGEDRADRGGRDSREALGVGGDCGPAVVADRGEHRGVGVDPPRVLAVGGQVRDELRRGDHGVPDRGGPLLLGQGGKGGHVKGPGAGDLLRAAGRPGGGQRGQGAGHVAARDERDAAVRGGEPQLPGPTRTSPLSTAVGATQAPGSTRGTFCS